MKRKILYPFLIVMSLFAFIFLLVSCDISSNANNDNSSNSTDINILSNPNNTGDLNTTDENVDISEESKITYTVIWKNDDGNVLDINFVEKGKIPEYSSETPTKDSTDEYSFTFSGWSPEITKVAKNVTYTATYISTKNKYGVTFVDDDGTILKGTTMYDYGSLSSSIEIPENPQKTSTPEYSYEFTGWDNEITSVTKDMTYTATYSKSIRKYNVKFVNSDGLVLKDTVAYDYGTKPENIIKPDNPTCPNGGSNYAFIGWEPKIEIVTADVTYKASYLLKYSRFGEKRIIFGRYPQSKVEASSYNGLASITFDESTWTSYKYYISSEQTDFMYYKDVDIDNDGIYDYRGVYFTQYRPSNTILSSSTSNSYQDNNSYYKEKIYWFKYESIYWNIITEEDGKVLINTDLLLDSQDFNPSNTDTSYSHNGGKGYTNEYELSNIRKFLNETFYNTAFNDIQKSIIEKTTLKNSNENSNYKCNDTNDKIFLLSWGDVYKGYNVELARQAEGSAYAKCQGLYVSTFKDNLGKSKWLTRHVSEKRFVYAVNFNGFLKSNSNPESVYSTECGVRPACWITL